MITDIRLMLLRRLAHSPSAGAGFTLIEMLVVVFIFTLLSTLAIPSMLHFANRSKESEARTYVSAINRGQQAHYLEYQQFGDLVDLDLGLTDTTSSYTYASSPTAPAADPSALTAATPVSNSMRGFAGKVWLGSPGDGSMTALSILCEGHGGTIPDLTTATECP